jgi:folate-dependent phosphoribosylglycinamide formyltransferase PurN
MAEALLRWFGEAYGRYRELEGVQCGERRGEKRGGAADSQLCAALRRVEAEVSAAAGYVRALAEKFTAAAGGG